MPMEIITDDKEITRAGFKWRENGGVIALVCTELERDGFSNAFSTRLGGVSPFPQDALNLAGFNDDAAENIYENRRRFLKLFTGEWTLAACWRRNCCQLGPERLGAGPEPAVSRMRLTVLGETGRPSFSNSPAMRG